MELYIKDINDPNYDPQQIQSDEEISMLLTQIEVMLFTRKGEVLGDSDFGANLEDYVYSFMYNDQMIKSVIIEQLERYIPLSKKFDTQVSVEFAQETERNLVFVDIVVDNKYQISVSI
jgi:hypothetical protein